MHDFVSDVGIANLALSHVGANSTIESFTESSTGAIQTNLWYDRSRLQALEAYDWGFARKRITMALHGDTISDTATDPLAGVWGFRYQYPSDCIAPRKIQNPNAPPDDAIPFDIETDLGGKQQTILTNQEDAVLVYTRDLHATDLFPSSFVMALSHLLASNIAYSITGKRSVAKEELATYIALKRIAEAEDANKQVSPPPRDADWIRARNGRPVPDLSGRWGR